MERIRREKTRVVKIGPLAIGGAHPVAVESMTNAASRDASGIIAQIRELEKAGCDLVRLALPDLEAARLVSRIRSQVSVPLMGDVHFDHRIALEAADRGIDSLRLNPGNIRQKDRVAEIVKKVKEKNIPVRIGANAGSVDRSRYKKNDADALVKSVLEHARVFEEHGFYKLIVSLKSHDVPATIEANKKFSRLRDYPLHIGITEAGTRFSGAVKSAVGVGILLYEGLGDTVRISLSGDPVEEVIVGHRILQALGLEKNRVEIISCPTCARTVFDVEGVASAIEKRTLNIRKNVRVAVMGCVVNGPGEAKEADIGVAGSPGKIVLFKKGRPVRSISRDQIIPEIMKYIQKS